MVNKLYSSIFFGFCFILVSCGGGTEQGKESSSNGSNQELQQPQIVFGIYADTLPCLDCPGVYTELTILPDTTYSLSEWNMTTSGRPSNSKLDRGIYSFSEGGKIKLTSRKEGNPERMITAGDKVFTIDPHGSIQSQGDFSLEMKEEWKGKMDGVNVFYKLAAFNGHPTMVFNSLKGNDSHIAKKYLEIAPESERAIVAYYASKYNTGCNSDRCALEEAMGLDNQQIQNLIGKWLPTKGNLTKSTNDRLLSLFIIQNGNDFQVNYSFSDADNNVISGNDIFKINEQRLDVTHNPTSKRSTQKSNSSDTSKARSKQ